jgi:hypothetical protein
MKKTRRELAALGFPEHIPTDALRNQVRMYAFNKVEHETIARVLDIDVGVLRYFYWRELSLTDVEIIARATQNILELAMQRDDRGVALKANELILKSRSSHWREPRAAEPPIADDMNLSKVERLTIEQVERALARIGSRVTAPSPEDIPGESEPE